MSHTHCRERPHRLPPRRTHPLILANLSHREFQRFHDANITYTASTGPSPTERYGKRGPYIATYLEHLGAAVVALHWKRFTVKTGKQWIARKRR